MREEIAADEKAEGPVGEDNIFSELQAVLMGIAEYGLLGERIVNEVRIARYGYEGESGNKTDDEDRQPAL
jgi:hypothetical protein